MDQRVTSRNGFKESVKDNLKETVYYVKSIVEHNGRAFILDSSG